MLSPRVIDRATAERILAGLAPELADEPVVAAGAGEDNIAFRVGEERLLRISLVASPRDRAAAISRDLALLGLIEDRLSVATSRPLAADRDAGALLLSWVPGEPVASVADAMRDSRIRAELGAAVGRELLDLGRIPLDSATTVAGSSAAAMRAWSARLGKEIGQVGPALSTADRALVTAFDAEPVPPEDRKTFCHNDLGEDHLLIDERSRLIGIIDWSDACVGDPARDLALLWFDLGLDVAAVAARVSGRDRDPQWWRKARWFAARAGVAGLAHRLAETGAIHPLTLDRLRRVLSDTPPGTGTQPTR